MGVPSPPGPRVLSWLGVPMAGLVLILFFIYLGFPYDLLAERVSRAVGKSGSLTLYIDELSPHLGLAGPGFKATGVTAGIPDGASLEIDRAVARAAWSLSWLRGTPAVHLDLESQIGSIVGTVTLGDHPRFRGELRQVELSEIPARQDSAGLSLRGRLDADLDVQSVPEDAGGGVAGVIQFVARDGSMSTETMPIEIPYDLMNGQVTLGGEHFAHIESFNLEGPMVSAEGRGSIGQASRLDQRPLDLELSYEIQEAEIEDMLRSFGVRLGPDGAGEVKVSGTIGKPRTVMR